MKRIILMFLCASLLLLNVSCGEEKPASESSKEESSDVKSKEESSFTEASEESIEESSEEESALPTSPISVLFVGNSFTFYNDLPVIFENIVKSAGVEATVRSVTVSSSRLEWFCDPSQSISKTFGETVDETVFDYVFLQEHSTRPYKDYDAFSKGIAEVCAKIREKSPDAAIVLYETWGFNENYSSLKEDGMTTKDQELLLLSSYEKAGEEHSLPVSFAGITHYKVYKETEYDPYHTDLKHPSYIGSFASALTHYYTVFPKASKESVTFKGKLSDKEFEDVRNIAYSVARNENITKEFKGE